MRTRLVSLLPSLFLVTLLSACGPSVTGGSGTLTIEGPAGLWPAEDPYASLEDGDPAVFEWDFTPDSRRAVLHRSPWRPWDLGVWIGRTRIECCEDNRDFEISLAEYSGPGDYEEEQVEVWFSDEIYPDFDWDEVEEAPEPRLLAAIVTSGCRVTVEDDPLVGSMTCEEARFTLDSVVADGSYSLSATWQLDDTVYVEER